MKTLVKSIFSVFLLWFFIFNYVAFAQDNKKIDAYAVENDGYFTHPIVTSKGIVLSDNFASKLYLIEGKELVELVAAPGCGKYISISEDKSKIGYKFIQPDGMQVPAIYDLQNKEITLLSNPVDLCGQVSFCSNGKVAFTVGNELNVLSNGITSTYDLGTYSNNISISPDGNSVVYNDNNDQLYLYDLVSLTAIKITDDQYGYAFPHWSPDGRKIAYSNLPGNLFVFDLLAKKTFLLGTGSNPSWTDDSQFLVYDLIKSENFEFNGSEIYMASYDGNKIIQLSNTSEVNEMYPVTDGGSIIFSTFEKRGIVSSIIDQNTSELKIIDTLYISSQPLSLITGVSDNFSQKSSKAITVVPGDVPYVHQRWDTPDWHAGSGSCAPTTAIMALGYFNRLPYWDITCASNPTSHTSHYGAYVADKYRFNEIYYDKQDTAYGTLAWGGYGYMWGYGSPNSYMHIYIQNHGLTSVHSTSTTFQNVTDEIDAGYPFPICNLLSAAGHLTLTVGYVIGQHTLIFNDPYGDKNDGSWGNLNNGKDSYYDWPGYNNGYQNLNTMAWTVTSETSEPVYNDTIIDDVYYNHGFYMYNQGLSLMRYFRDSKTGGYNGHFWYTGTCTSTTADTCYVTWTAKIPVTGNYEVFTYIPTVNASATNARYKVYYNGGMQTVIINQAPIYGQWVSLGIFPFLQGNSGYVRLGDGTGEQGKKVAFDAMKWVYRDKSVNLTVFLEGAYNTGTGLMNTTLNTGALIPLNQPFNTTPWNYTGTESVASIPANVVDWVLVDLRDAASAATAVPATHLTGWPKAYFLKSDGSIVNLDGTSKPNIGNPTISNSLFAVVHHRNHIAIMSNTGLANVSGTYTYDFSSAITQAYGGNNGYKQIPGSSVFGMVAGDINADGNIFATDYTGWVSSFGNTSSYLKADINMDGNVFTTDYTKWVTNFGLTNPIAKSVSVSKYSTQVPK